MAQNEHERVREAYLQMAKKAKYRPAAPSDGFGTVLLRDEQLQDDLQLDNEATKYADDFIREENTRQFFVGVSDYATNRAFVYSLEAARLLCTGRDGARFAHKLLSMAVLEIEREAALVKTQAGS